MIDDDYKPPTSRLTIHLGEFNGHTTDLHLCGVDMIFLHTFPGNVQSVVDMSDELLMYAIIKRLTIMISEQEL